MNNEDIEATLRDQNEPELYFECIIRGFDFESRGEPFFNFFNSKIVEKVSHQGCNYCNLGGETDVSDTTGLGYLDILLPIAPTNGENLHHIFMAHFSLKPQTCFSHNKSQVFVK